MFLIFLVVNLSKLPMPLNFSKQEDLSIPLDFEISQIGTIVDNTTKTRYIFEINKGGNKNPSIDVNAQIDENDRRVPINRMLYIADGPSDIPCFSVVKNNGGKTFAVFQPENDAEFAQNDSLLHAGGFIHMALQITEIIVLHINGFLCM